MAPALRVPYPILLVLGGLAIGFVPGMPRVELEPEIIFFGVLPPLLYGAAFFTSLRELSANVRPIGLLAVGLVLVTTVGVAVVAHAFIDGLSWASAFVLGAIVSPTDPFAATDRPQVRCSGQARDDRRGRESRERRQGLVLYRVAVAAVVLARSRFLHGWGVPGQRGGGMPWASLVGWLVRPVRRRVDDPPAEITISLLTRVHRVHPGGADRGLGRPRRGDGRHLPRLAHAGADSAQVRLQGRCGLGGRPVPARTRSLFVLVGLQLPVVLDALDGCGRSTPARFAVLVSLHSHPLPTLRRGSPCSTPRTDREGISDWRASHLRLLGGDARRGVARGGPRAAPPDRRRLRRSPGGY